MHSEALRDLGYHILAKEYEGDLTSISKQSEIAFSTDFYFDHPEDRASTAQNARYASQTLSLLTYLNPPIAPNNIISLDKSDTKYQCSIVERSKQLLPVELNPQYAVLNVVLIKHYLNNFLVSHALEHTPEVDIQACAYIARLMVQNIEQLNERANLTPAERKQAQISLMEAYVVKSQFEINIRAAYYRARTDDCAQRGMSAKSSNFATESEILSGKLAAMSYMLGYHDAYSAARAFKKVEVGQSANRYHTKALRHYFTASQLMAGAMHEAGKWQNSSIRNFAPMYFMDKATFKQSELNYYQQAYSFLFNTLTVAEQLSNFHRSELEETLDQLYALYFNVCCDIGDYILSAPQSTNTSDNERKSPKTYYYEALRVLKSQWADAPDYQRRLSYLRSKIEAALRHEGKIADQGLRLEVLY